VKIHIQGIEQAMANLGALPRKVALKHLRIALSAAGGEVKQQVIALVPRRTKLLAQSQAVKVKIPAASWDVKHHHKPAYVVIGTKRGAVGAGIRAGGKLRKVSIRKATKHVLGGGQVQTIRPSRYAHLANIHTKYMDRASHSAGPRAAEKAAEKLAKAFETEAAALSTKLAAVR